MFISSINQTAASNSAPSTSQDSVSLSARVSALQNDSVTGLSEVPPANDPGVTPITDFNLEEIYQWLVANSESMISDPQMMINGVISKLKKLTRSDGTPIYKDYNDISVAVASLKKRCDDTGIEYGTYFDKLTGTVFGMGLYMNKFIFDIFLAEDDGNPKNYF